MMPAAAGVHVTEQVFFEALLKPEVDHLGDIVGRQVGVVPQSIRVIHHLHFVGGLHPHQEENCRATANGGKYLVYC